jgi:alpha-glucan,water dikinase
MRSRVVSTRLSTMRLQGESQLAHCLQGGMMEEWHQKLHNNSSPDDLAICQALLDYLASGQNIQIYWDSLAKEGINAERLASYDRPIHSAPPAFNPQQVPQLTEDLIAYRCARWPQQAGIQRWHMVQV